MEINISFFRLNFNRLVFTFVLQCCFVQTNGGMIDMLRLLKTLLKVGIFLGIVVTLFALLMFGAKIWGIYSVPPSEQKPKGATWIISRYEDEPLFNASDRSPPPPPEEEPKIPPTGMFDGGPMKRDPIEKRIILTLPFTKWVHERGKDTTGVR